MGRLPDDDEAQSTKTEGTVNASNEDRAPNERNERVARAIQERARRLEILDRQTLARKQAEDRRLQEEPRR